MGGAALRDSGFRPSESQTLSEVFDSAFRILSSDERNEYVYKNVIAERILLGRHSIKTASMLTEFRSGSSKADVVILNGTATAYEIKSERDTLNRLDDQLYDYLGIFEHVVVVTARAHLNEVLDRVPRDVGVSVLSDRCQISTIRKPISDLRRLDHGKMFESLQRKEYLAILASALNWSPAGIPNGLLHGEAKKAFAGIPIEQVQASFVSILKQRAKGACPGAFLMAVPSSLKAMAISTELAMEDQNRILRAMTFPATECLPIS